MDFGSGVVVGSYNRVEDIVGFSVGVGALKEGGRLGSGFVFGTWVGLGLRFGTINESVRLGVGVALGAAFNELGGGIFYCDRVGIGMLVGTCFGVDGHLVSGDILEGC